MLTQASFREHPIEKELEVSIECNFQYTAHDLLKIVKILKWCELNCDIENYHFFFLFWFLNGEMKVNAFPSQLKSKYLHVKAVRSESISVSQHNCA